MATLCQLLVLVIVVGVILYRRMALTPGMLIVGVWLAFMTWWSHVSWLLWLLYVSAAILLFVDDLRQRWITGKVFEVFKRVLPPMTRTEKEALEAGDVWWETKLFRGTPDWQQLIDMPLSKLSAEEKAFLDNETETLCAMLDDWRIVHKDKDLPEDVWQYIKAQGFLGMIIPKEYGGKGFSAIAHSTVVMKIATRSLTAAVTCMVPNSLGPAELLMQYGTQAQKDQYLPRLAKGEELPCFALTAPEAGSDAGSIPDRGVVCRGMYQGEEVLGIKLTFDKRYITLAPVATLFGLAFKLYDPEQLLGETKELGITVCLIPTSHPGVEIGSRHFPMGLTFMNGPIRGKDVFVPIDWIVGGAEYAGQGWRMLMDCLSAGRAISLPALSTATAKLSYRMTGAYTTIREQFKTPIHQFEGVRQVMAEIAGSAYILEAARRMTATAVDQHIKPSVVSAIAKYHMTEMGRDVLNHALDIHGGRGIMFGERNYLGHAYLGVPISITVEGANILTRNLMIFGQGAIRCHPYILAEMEAVQIEDQAQALARFDDLLMSHVGYSASNFTRTLVLGLTGARFVSTPIVGDVAKYYRQLSRMSAAFAFTSDIAMSVLGGGLKRRECLSARLGDILSELYLASSVLKYYEFHGRIIDELPYVAWAVQRALYNIQQSFIAFIDNFPNRLLAKLLKVTVFPLGYCYTPPKDCLSEQLIVSMVTDSELRERLTQYCFVGHEASDATGRIESAFVKVLEAEPIERKIRKAQKAGVLDKNLLVRELIDDALNEKIIDETEAELLKTAEDARLDAIQVDDMPSL